MDLLNALNPFVILQKYFIFTPFLLNHNTHKFCAQRIRKYLFAFTTLLSFVALCYFNFNYYLQRYSDTVSQTNDAATFLDNFVISIKIVIIKFSSLWYCHNQVDIFNDLIVIDCELKYFGQINYSRINHFLKYNIIFYVLIVVATIANEFEFYFIADPLFNMFCVVFKLELLSSMCCGLMICTILLILQIQVEHLKKNVNGGWDLFVFHDKLLTIVDRISQSFYCIPLGLTITSVTTGLCFIYRFVWMFLNRTLSLHELQINFTIGDCLWFVIYIVMIFQITYASVSLNAEVR